MNATYQLARLYVHHCGFSVLPLWYRQKRRMFSGTTFQERIPAPSDLTHWFTRHPANIAIVPGEISGNLVILDFDDVGTWSVFHALTGWQGPIVRTGRGVHVYLRVKQPPDRNGQGFFEGVHFGEILVKGAITAPPSVHPSGHVYAWHGSPVRLPFLNSLESLSIERRDTQGNAEPRKTFQPAQKRAVKPVISHTEAYIAAAIRGECAKVLSAVEGSRHNQLYESALKLAKYTEMVSPGEISAHLQAAARQAGLDRGKVKNTIDRGLSMGRANGVL